MMTGNFPSRKHSNHNSTLAISQSAEIFHIEAVRRTDEVYRWHIVKRMRSSDAGQVAACLVVESCFRVVLLSKSLMLGLKQREFRSTC